MLRKEGQRFKNHHVDLFGIELDEGTKKFLGQILSDASSNLTLFPDKEPKATKLIEGYPIEIEAHSNSLFLKKDWQNCVNVELSVLEETLKSLIEKEQYKVNIHLTTYKYPVVYENEDGFFRRECLRKKVVSLLRRPINI